MISYTKSLSFFAFVDEFHSDFVQERHAVFRARAARQRDAASCEKMPPEPEARRADSLPQKRVTHCSKNSAASSNLSAFPGTRTAPSWYAFSLLRHAPHCTPSPCSFTRVTTPGARPRDHLVDENVLEFRSYRRPLRRSPSRSSRPPSLSP